MFSTRLHLPTACFGRAALAVALVGLAAPALAQHEVQNSSAGYEPIVINGNENAFGYSPMAVMAMMEEMTKANRYGRDQAMALIEAIAAKEGVPANHVMITAGSGPVLQMTAAAYAQAGKNVVTVVPGYTQLTRAFEGFGGTVKAVPVGSDYGYDFTTFRAAMDANTAIAYVCNPNNPTGVLCDPVQLATFVNTAPKDVLVFVDEAYLELAPGGLEKNSMVRYVKSKENVIIARTFSKAHGMAGLRIGYAVANPKILAKLRPYYQGTPNVLACVAGIASINDTENFAANVENYTRVRNMTLQGLRGLGLTVAEPAGSFVFVKTGVPIEQLSAKMAEKRISIGRPFPPMLDHARVSIGTEEEMTIFLRVFEEVMRELNALPAGA